MKLKEIADIIKGAYLIEGKSGKPIETCKELTMVSLEPISFLDERKMISVNCSNEASEKQLTREGDVVVSLYQPMIACYVEKGQEGYVVPHYMAIVRKKPYVKMDSRFMVQFINSPWGRRALAEKLEKLSHYTPSSLPIKTLSQVELLAESNQILERY